ncbi:Squalene/phytoene synthase [Ceratobasidium sp. AG-Ba]|nr:Squalene/phytoene synthase [Ceratobasidium sp. AG-Ba]QRW06511.1 Squalene/phytoene synthase [Ceratobasidium sp. AG-Ba]
MFSPSRHATFVVQRLGRKDHGLRKLARRFATNNSSVNAGGTSDANTYCRELVRKHDYEAYLCSYFYPRAAQPGYFALRAFNVELAMIRETVSRPIIGKMRMQFWKDAIDSIAKNRPVKHPIAIALHEASQTANLPAYHLKRMETDLERDSYQTLADVTQYAESTSSTLMYLLLNLLHQGTSDTSTHAASHVGIAHSFSVLLRGLPFHASRRRMVIPAEITAKYQVQQEEVFRVGGHAARIDDAVFEFATVANDNLLTARESFKDSKVPAEAMPAFLLAVPVASYLTRLESVNFDAFAPQLQTKEWKLPFNIWRAFRTKMF